MSADCEPTIRLAIGPERALYLLMIATWIGIARDVARDDDVVRGRALDVLRLVVDPEVDVGDQPAERGSARHELAVDVADVRLMRVRRDDDVNLRRQPVDDRDDVAGEVVAAVGVHVAERERPFCCPPWWIRTTKARTPWFAVDPRRGC
jgi:hypothetical protein